MSPAPSGPIFFDQKKGLFYIAPNLDDTVIDKLNKLYASKYYCLFCFMLYYASTHDYANYLNFLSQTFLIAASGVL